MIPKPGSSKLRRLGIPTARDRVVQASLALVLEPIFEADFKPVSYGFRPNRRAQDAIAEIHASGTRQLSWVFEADIQACFDELKHSAVIAGMRKRDRRQTRLDPDRQVPQSRHHVRYGGDQGHRHRDPARRKHLPAAGQYCSDGIG